MLESADAQDGKRIDQGQERNDRIQCPYSDGKYKILTRHRIRFKREWRNLRERRVSRDRDLIRSNVFTTIRTSIYANNSFE